MVVLFASCGGILPTGPKPEDLAKGLADKMMELIQSGEEPTHDQLREIIYVPNEDAANMHVQLIVLSLKDLLMSEFLTPSTPTSISVVGVTEASPGHHPWIISGKPEFVENVYIVTYRCLRTNTTSTLELPMITVHNEDKGFFFAVYIKQTDGATSVAVYPGFPPPPGE